MESLINTIKKRHEETLDYYQNEILTEGEKKILRSEMAFLLMILDDAEALLIQRVSQQRELLEDYQHFIDWNEEHDRKASTSERIESFIASNCG